MAFLKINLFFLLVAVSAIYQANTSAIRNGDIDVRADLIVGDHHHEDTILYKMNIARPAKPDGNVFDEIVYQGDTLDITHIMALEEGTSQGAKATLASGGLGEKYAIIQLLSAKSKGYNYTISIYGK